MKPDENSSGQSGLSLPQQGLNTNEAAASVIRSQIDKIYNDNIPDDNRAVSSTPIEDINPYHKTHSEHPTIEVSEWKQYHTAWQNYYQKYYEGYYTQHLQKARQVLEQKGTATNSKHDFFANKKAPEPDKTFSTDEALFDMRQEIIGKVMKSATKIKKSRHFIPILSGLVVIIFFLFLQYNRVLISNVMAYVSPGSIDQKNIIIDPNANIAVPTESKIIIPKINVDVPVIYDIGNDYNSLMGAMAKGVAQFAIPGASSHPGEIGNTVISGHSSNDLFDQGDYKFIFAQLEQLNVGDTIYANYKSKRYTYTVTKKEVVPPNDVSKLVYPTTKPILTLITCTPIGTSLNRLLVTAEQISPDPSQSNPAPANIAQKTTSIPGSSPTFFERIFGAK